MFTTESWTGETIKIDVTKLNICSVINPIQNLYKCKHKIVSNIVKSVNNKVTLVCYIVQFLAIFEYTIVRYGYDMRFKIVTIVSKLYVQSKPSVPIAARVPEGYNT